MKKPHILPLTQLQPGMKVAAAVADEAGRMLLPAGAELSEAIITGLGRRGIEQVGVELELPEDPAALAQRRQEVSERLGRLFRRAGEGEQTQALYQAVERYRLEQQP